MPSNILKNLFGKTSPFYYINFLSALLLFQIELIISKIFLPAFGGSYLVWGACLVFFQATLLAGYLYSHIVVTKLGIARYRYFHILLVFIPLLFFPGRPLPKIIAHQGIPLVIDIFWQLLLTVGPVFFVLSTTSIIFQAWLSETKLTEHKNPYFLYAVSNLGSFLALLSYPLILESYFDINIQLNFWRLGYGLLLALHLLAISLVEVDKISIASREVYLKSLNKDRIYWFLLGAAPTMMFLSVTNVITYEMTPAPLLWVLPLAIYLLSFVLNFAKKPYCPIWIKDKFHLVIGFGILFFFMTKRGVFPFPFEFFGHLILLFAICMFAQNKLYAAKPKNPNNLTEYYFIFSLGSFLGGVVVTWLIPASGSLFSGVTFEYMLSMFVLVMSLYIREKITPVGSFVCRLVIYFITFLFAWPIVFKKYNFFGLIFAIYFTVFIFTRLKDKIQKLFLAVFCITLISPLIGMSWQRFNSIYDYRNYYGLYNVSRATGMRMLLNGTTMHGAQYTDNKKELEPIAYYHKLTPLYNTLKDRDFSFRKMGVIGLGAGVMASFVTGEDQIDFYELDPDVYRIAKEYFTFLKTSKAKISYIFGDARITLSKNPDRKYDCLIVDAFSGDSVPAHLLTVEAMEEYKKHLTKEGVIIFHISNRYVDIVPILFSNAKVLDCFVAIGKNAGSPKDNFLATMWGIYTWDHNTFNRLIKLPEWQLYNSDKPIEEKRFVRPWKDSYSNILAVLKYDQFFNAIRDFRLFSW